MVGEGGTLSACSDDGLNGRELARYSIDFNHTITEEGTGQICCGFPFKQEDILFPMATTTRQIGFPKGSRKYTQFVPMFESHVCKTTKR